LTIPSSTPPLKPATHQTEVRIQDGIEMGHPPGSGGLVSTTSDYVRFAQMLLNGGELDGTRLLGRKTVEMMTLNHLPSHLMPIWLGANPMRGLGYGLGFGVVVDLAQTGLLGSKGVFGWGRRCYSFLGRSQGIFDRPDHAPVFWHGGAGASEL
jgi:CubicO group peptidase (beta-lactamase class C family)